MKNRYIFLISLPLVVFLALFLIGITEPVFLVICSVSLAIIGYVIGGIFDYINSKRNLSGININQSKASILSRIKMTIICGLAGFLPTFILMLFSFKIPGLGTLGAVALFYWGTAIGVVLGVVLDIFRYFVSRTK